MGKHFFFLRMAWNNLRKNRRLFVPQILTAGGLTAVFYIICAISGDPAITESRGGTYLPVFMQIGLMVTAILAAVLMLYTNSFIIKRRRHEFGLYMVLGMEKRHVAKIQLRETIIAAIGSIVSGLAAGLLLYKLCALFICRLLHIDSELGNFHVSTPALLLTGGYFLLLFLLMAAVNRIQLARSSPKEMLTSNQTGEREPKIKWVVLVIGLAALGTGYGIALSAESVLKALNMFFIAVLLVVIGTYCLFISGSIAVLKALRKNKKFYYHPRHMTAVSGLLYRMKQNAVGLASICILATCVIVMLSATVSLCTGTEQALNEMYQDDLYIKANYADDKGQLIQVDSDTLRDWLQQAADENHVQILSTRERNYLVVSYLLNGDELVADPEGTDQISNLSHLITCFFVTADQYEKMTGETVSLDSHETAVYVSPRNTGTLPETFRLAGETWHRTQKLQSFPISTYEYGLTNCYGIVVKDDAALEEIDKAQQQANGTAASTPQMDLAVKYKLTAESPENAFTDAPEGFWEEMRELTPNGFGTKWSSRADTETYLYSMYGTFLFLGIILGMVFLFATALIIYYKQISEGYEDRERFQIMRKVGMSDAETKHTIRTQILLVFFLPLLVAAIHVCVAFPILCKLLFIFFLPDTMLFAASVAGTFVVFALIYTLIYSLTANMYYKIVR